MLCTNVIPQDLAYLDMYDGQSVKAQNTLCFCTWFVIYMVIKQKNLTRLMEITQQRSCNVLRIIFPSDQHTLQKYIPLQA